MRSIFKEKVGAISVKQLVRIAKERHAGSMGYAEAMLIEYNGKKKSPAQRLSINKLHARESSIFSGLEDSSATDEEWKSPIFLPGESYNILALHQVFWVVEMMLSATTVNTDSRSCCLLAHTPL